MKSTDRLYGLDVLRSVAIILVVLSHGRHHFTALVPNLDDFFVFGYLGVELFFVLSGFLIGGILLRSITASSEFRDVKNFWVRRWFRTIPNYYLFLIIEILIAVFITHIDIIPNIWRYLVFAQTFLTVERPVVFNVSWSLAVEEWFYLLIPILFFLSARFVRTQLRACLMVMSIGLVAPLFYRIYSVYFYDTPWGPDIRNVTVMRLDSIMYGFVGAVAFQYFRRQWDDLAYPLFVFGLTLILFNSVYVQLVDLDRDWYARTLQFSVVPFAFLCMLPLARKANPSRYLAETVTKISAWSYSLYLCHSIILRFTLNGQSQVANLIARFDFHSTLSNLVLWVSSFAFFAIFIGFSLFISANVYKYFEVPVMNLRDRFSNREPISV